MALDAVLPVFTCSVFAPYDTTKVSKPSGDLLHQSWRLSQPCTSRWRYICGFIILKLTKGDLFQLCTTRSGEVPQNESEVPQGSHDFQLTQRGNEHPTWCSIHAFLMFLKTRNWKAYNMNTTAWFALNQNFPPVLSPFPHLVQFVRFVEMVSAYISTIKSSGWIWHEILVSVEESLILIIFIKITQKVY